jgi:predicted nucleic acid-binding protein
MKRARLRGSRPGPQPLVTPHEAVYLALAEMLDATLLTRDRRFARTVGHHVRVELA